MAKNRRKTPQGNRGMILEKIIQVSSKQYKTRGQAVIDKIPTPVRITGRRGKMISGTLAGKSTVDYTGLLEGGQAVAFEAKETKGNYLPFDNIRKHQIEYMDTFASIGGKAFFIVYFSEHDKYYRLGIKEVMSYMKTPTGNKKSIPIEYFKDQGLELKSESGLYLNFLKDL